jgi:hypothetical protein
VEERKAENIRNQTIACANALKLSMKPLNQKLSAMYRQILENERAIDGFIRKEGVMLQSVPKGNRPVVPYPEDFPALFTQIKKEKAIEIDKLGGTYLRKVK